MSDARDAIQKQKKGTANNGIKGDTNSLSTLVEMTIGGNCPYCLFTLSNGQAIGLRYIGRLKREALEAMSPVQQAEQLGACGTKITAAIEEQNKILTGFHFFLLL